MSIFCAFGAAPLKVTVPLTLAAVAGSTGAEVAAGFISEVGAVLCSSLVFSFLLHPASNPSRQSRNIAAQSFLFMCRPFVRIMSLTVVFCGAQHSTANHRCLLPKPDWQPAFSCLSPAAVRQHGRVPWTPPLAAVPPA